VQACAGDRTATRVTVGRHGVIAAAGARRYLDQCVNVSYEPKTAKTYHHVVRKHIAPPLGTCPHLPPNTHT
jgi:hypothetical protein